MLSLAIKSLSITIALAATSQPALACGFYLDRMEELKQLSQAAITTKEQKAVGDYIGFVIACFQTQATKSDSNYESWAICFGTNTKELMQKLRKCETSLNTI